MYPKLVEAGVCPELVEAGVYPELVEAGVYPKLVEGSALHQYYCRKAGFSIRGALHNTITNSNSNSIFYFSYYKAQIVQYQCKYIATI